MKQKMTYMQKIRLALFFDMGQVITLLIVGCGVTAVFTPLFINDMTLRILAALAGGAVALAIGLPLGCMRRLQAIDKDFGEGVADEVVAWHQTAQKGDVLDLQEIAEKIQSDKKQKID